MARTIRSVAIGILAATTLAACVTSPTGRRQLILLPEAQLEAMGVAAYDQMKAEIPISRDAASTRYVRCVGEAITRALAGPEAARSWEVTLFEDESANAFALPGGKIGVHTGLLAVAHDQHQLATVMGHEVAHVLARHSNERVSQQQFTELGLAVAGAGLSPGMAQVARLGAQLGVLLPYGRAQESEADVLGLDLMARAGFDPRASVQLWRNMASTGGQQPPAFLSTHPSHEDRIARLAERVPAALEIQARSGRRPDCR